MVWNDLLAVFLTVTLKANEVLLLYTPSIFLLFVNENYPEGYISILNCN
jgi:hypothetical protein